MKSKLTLALAASMLTLALAASPQRASAAYDNFATLDDGGSDSGSSSGSNSSSEPSIWGFILYLFS